jgi:FkbM family methyltransferase
MRKYRMKQLIARTAEHLGYSIVPKWRCAGLAMANRLRDIFAHFGIDRVIDIGANQGQFGDFLRLEVGFKGEIESFEPVPELADKLKAHAASDPLWSVHACAMGRKPGKMPINVMVGSCYSSFRNPLPIAIPAHDLRNTVARTVTVPLTTLDAEFARMHDLRRTYLKLDTQGFDLEVLAGGHRTISGIPALQTEISFAALYEGTPDYKESIAAFEQHGFAVADMFLVATDGKHRAMEFDCVMVRR